MYAHKGRDRGRLFKCLGARHGIQLCLHPSVYLTLIGFAEDVPITPSGDDSWCRWHIPLYKGEI